MHAGPSTVYGVLQSAREIADRATAHQAILARRSGTTSFTLSLEQHSSAHRARRRPPVRTRQAGTAGSGLRQENRSSGLIGSGFVDKAVPGSPEALLRCR